MTKIFEKPEFIKMTAVKVCTKAGIGSNRVIKILVFVQIFREYSRWLESS